MTIISLVRRLVAALALIALLAPTGFAAAAELPAGWQLHTVGDYQIAAPAAWAPISLDRASIEKTITLVARGNPELAGTLQQLVDSGQYKALKLFAVDPKTGSNLAYASTAMPLKLTTRQVAAAAVDLLPKQLPGVKIVHSRSDAQLNGMAAARIEYDLNVKSANGKTTALRGVQYYVPLGASIHIITVTGTPTTTFVTLADRVAGTFDRSQGTAPAASANQATARTNANVRSAPSIRGTIVAGLKAGERVTLLGKNKDASWFKIRTAKAITGWASATVLNVDAGAAANAPVLP